MYEYLYIFIELGASAHRQPYCTPNTFLSQASAPIHKYIAAQHVYIFWVEPKPTLLAYIQHFILWVFTYVSKH